MPPIALIAAFVPPICGQSLAAELLRSGLKQIGASFFELNLSEPIAGASTFKRILQLALIEGKLIVLCIKYRNLIVYFQLGHGKLAIIRDLVFMATATALRHPCIAHVHGSGFRKALDGLPQPLRNIETHFIKKLHAAIVLSPSLKEMFAGILPDDRIFAVDNGIDQNFVDLITEREPSNRPLQILFLSNFLSAKGFSTLLRTAVLAKNAHKNWTFAFVGAKIPKQDVDIDAFIKDYQLDNVCVHNVVEGIEKHHTYLNSDVFVLPSAYEGQPLCLLEAMFESLPIITTPVGGIPEIFSDDSGVLFVEPNHPEQIFDALNKLDNHPDLREQMGKNNKNLAFERFTAQKHIDQMVKIILNNGTVKAKTTQQ